MTCKNLRFSLNEVFNSSTNSAVYCCSDKYSQAFLISISSFRITDSLTDITLEVGCKLFKAHKIVLAAACPYFKAMFLSDFKESMSSSIKISDVSAECMETVLHFIYSGTIEIFEETVEEILKVANMMQITIILSACQLFLKRVLNSKNSINILRMAELYIFDELITLARKSIVENFTEIVQCEDFYKISASNMELIISDHNLSIHSELDAMNAVLDWMEHNEIGSELALLSLLSVIRMSLLSKLDLEKQMTRNIFQRLPLLDYYFKQVAKTLNMDEITLSLDRCRCQEMYIVSGADNCKSFINFNPHNGESVILCNLPTDHSFSGCAVILKNLFVVGGISAAVNKYNLEENVWINCCPMSIVRKSAAIVKVRNVIYVIGGESTDTTHKTVECYHTEQNVWSMRSSMLQKRAYMGAALVNGYIYVIAGWDGSSNLNTCERYCLNTNTWELISSMPIACRRGAVVSWNESIYMIGGTNDTGLNGSNYELDSIYKYNTITEEWSSCNKMPYAACDLSACTAVGKIYITGGYYQGAGLKKTAIFNIKSGKWKKGPNLPLACRRHCTCFNSNSLCS